MEHEYQNVKSVVCDSDDEHGRAYFIPVCQKCKKFVKPYDQIVFDYEGQPIGANAECSECGPVEMLFEGYL